jgi:two-component system nitrogen regulation response regulator GlnG
MPLELQTRLLRVLSDGQFYRVGGHNPLKSNVRVIAATHQDLEARVKQGSFREDLYHRLNVIRLRLPALRERREDIPALTRFFLAKSARELSVEAKRISEPALQVLRQFDFPGNVRQLQNVCHWLTVMAPAQVIETKDLPPELASALSATGAVSPPVTASPSASASPRAPMPAPVDTPSHDATVPAPVTGTLPSAAAAPASAAGWLDDLGRETLALLQAGAPSVWDGLTRQFEARLIQAALSVTRGRRIEAAQKLGIGRNTITRKIQELGLDD